MTKCKRTSCGSSYCHGNVGRASQNIGLALHSQVGAVRALRSTKLRIKMAGFSSIGFESFSSWISYKPRYAMLYHRSPLRRAVVCCYTLINKPFELPLLCIVPLKGPINTMCHKQLKYICERHDDLQAYCLVPNLSFNCMQSKIILI